MLAFVRARLGGDRGLALPMVIGITSVMLLLVTAGIALALGGLRQANNTESWSASLAAAYAGVEEYQSRLANDTTYMRYGNPDAPFTIEAASPDAVTLPSGLEANPAFGLGVDGPWASVQGSEGAQFRYEVDNSRYIASGVIRLRSTGKVGTETRSILADLRQDGFIDFLYFTDYEMKDPDLGGLNAAQRATCVKYSHEGRPRFSRSNGTALNSDDNRTGTLPCGDIAFGENDAINGPTHSNDTIRACGTEFNGVVTTADPSGSVLTQNSSRGSCGANDFSAIPNSPRIADDLEMPLTNTTVARETRADLGDQGVPRPGCLYTGPTKITMHSDGTMTVYSPWTRATQVIGEPATGAHANTLCGTTGTAGLGRTSGQRIAVPENNVIYVQSVPGTSGSNPNAWAANTFPAGIVCEVPTAWDRRGNPTAWRSTNGIGYPIANEVAPYPSGAQQSYGCRNGDLFVQGTLDGNITMSAQNYIYVTGNIQYEDSDDDVLGLISNNIVWVWNPINSSGSALLSDHDRRIDAAILSVQRTFTVQNHGKGGDRGELEINGAIAQVYRGIVFSRDGTSGGYTKEYNYDTRFINIAPPRFLSPVTTTYGVTTWIEVDPAFRADGTER